MMSAPPMKDVDKSVICPEFVEIDNFKIRYVYPDPLPDYVRFLQRLRCGGIEFVKIPISIDEDRYYLARPITKLLASTGVYEADITKLIKEYNEGDNANVKIEKRLVLLDLMKFTLYICKEKNIEFLTE